MLYKTYPKEDSIWDPQRKQAKDLLLQAFYSKCIIHINGKENIGKLNTRSDEGIIVPYFQQSKARRVYNKTTEVVKENIYVMFTKNNHGILCSTSSQDLKLSRHEDDEEDRAKFNTAIT